MKSLVLAAAALLSIGAEAALAESSDGWDMPRTTPAATVTARLAQPQDAAILAYNEMTGRVAPSRPVAAPQSVASVAPRLAGCGKTPMNHNILRSSPLHVPCQWY
jgi:hypothetical protein